MNIAIVDDEKEASACLKQYLCQYAEKMNLSLSIDIFSDGLSFLDQLTPKYDVVFMDIEMPGIDGMETAKRLRRIDKECCLIFVTNVTSMAIQGYEYAAMFYLVKPLDYSVFAFKFDRVMEWYGRQSKKEILINVKGGARKISVNDIYYVEVIRHDVIYHTTDGEIVTRDTMTNVEKSLPDFARCNVCYLVNLKYVKDIKGEEVKVGNDWLKISSPKKKQFTEALFRYMKGSIIHE